jgi:hypothetical protein
MSESASAAEFVPDSRSLRALREAALGGLIDDLRQVAREVAHLGG